jgi:hypothetical protein
VSVAACESTEQESAKIAREEPQPAVTNTTAKHTHKAARRPEHKRKAGASASGGK